MVRSESGWEPADARMGGMPTQRPGSRAPLSLLEMEIERREQGFHRRAFRSRWMRRGLDHTLRHGKICVRSEGVES